MSHPHTAYWAFILSGQPSAMEHELKLRSELIACCHKMADRGLTFGTSGNASVRLDSHRCLITPSAVPYETLQPDDIVALEMNGKHHGRHAPSSEWRFHLDILKDRTDIHAVVHTHSKMATALACQNKSIPAFHYMVAVAGGAYIRCARYATFGTQYLSDNILMALDGRLACLMANHGQIALGSTLESALKMAGEVETLADMYWHAQQGGDVVLLSDAEMANVIEKFKTYGHKE